MIEATNEKLVSVISSKDNILAGKSQVVKVYAATVLKAITEVMEGRYGDGGVSAVLQFITEQNPEIDPAIYQELSQAVESLFKDIEAANRVLVDEVRNY